ncbi:restriction endonuclease [Streptomyces sp. NPDC005962]|uniref:restriction endonuclease n=1 Tax=Streptomyces sp. NPDC005962 TaxID=3154466 RepID=UPI0033C05433
MSRHSGRSSGLISLWAEAQRQREAQERARIQREREWEREEVRRLRAAERERGRDQRERQAAYRRQREADARRRTEELEARVEALRSLLAAGCRAPAFRPDGLQQPERVEPFDPGALAHPVPMPDQRHYPPQGGGWGLGSGRREREETRERYERDWRAAQAAEAERVRQLAAYERQYERWAAQRLAEIRRHNEGAAELAAEVRAGDPEAVVEYFTAALYHSAYASPVWPEGPPREMSAAYDPAARQLVVDWELPRYDIVPETKSVRYMPSADEDRETARPATQRRALYRDVLAQCVLLALRDLFAADASGALESVALNGFVDDHDPATGHRARIVLATVTVSRTDFAALRLEQVSAVECLVDGVRGRLSTRPDQRAAVAPGRTPDEVGSGVLTQGGGDEPDLHAMDPIAFESLVADLFRAMGMRAVTTRRSNDGGVDVEAMDPTPIRGGRIVVQVKRYRGTVPPTAVRDLYGTVQGSGANKGVLVTTSRFGPGSHTFARGKPLELVSGAELVDLLHRHGLRGRLGDGATAPGPASAAGPPDHNVLGMSWSGAVALDVCALVCDGDRVLSDDHFVFFNNPRTPDGTVSALPATAPDRAAVRVAFDALPPEADRLVLAAAVDPEADPGADLSGFADARIRLLDASGAELGQLEVSDGRPGETALVLGSFRRRAGGDWDFVIGGKGYPGGLEALVREYGIDVA